MEYKDYYKVMGVPHNATQEEVRRAFRKLARKFHPDVSKEPDAEARFKELGEANEVLKDPEKRAAYDELGTQWKSGQEFRTPPDWGAGFEFNGGANGATHGGVHSDFFEELFGHGRASSAESGNRHRFHSRGDDHHAKVFVDLADSFHGATRAISLRMPYVNEDGRLVTQNRTLRVQVPKGIRPGQQIRLKGQGGPGHGGSANGDLYLDVAFNEHPLYRVEGGDIYLELPVAPWEAALGAKIKVPTPTGTIDLKIPRNSTQGSKLRLKGRGLTGKQQGDMYVVLQLTLPSCDDDTAKLLYQKMQDQLGYNPRASMEASLDNG